ncbi:uncharacterized protein LOC129583697 isoform X2 [Paramacrobiotus metropolitanus]|nr:uncharacterized protein LOC129583697 isoform X2 [Paramacrobiotus metropolitanus]
MLREGLAEVEREQVAQAKCDKKRYQISNIPFLGTDVIPRIEDIVPKPRVIYENDSDYIRMCKRGGRPDLIWWYPDYPVDSVTPEESAAKGLAPKHLDWSMHLSSFLPSPQEEFLKNRKFAPCQKPDPEKLHRLDPTKLPTATGKPREYTWEAGMQRQPPNMYGLITNGYVKPYQVEMRKRHYFQSLFDRPQNEDEKLQEELYEQQRRHNDVLRERAARFNRLSKGQHSWTPEEREKTSKSLFPRGYGRGVRAPSLLPNRTSKTKY